MFKNKFKLSLIAPVFIIVGIVGAVQAQAGDLSAESLAKDHPCYKPVYRANDENIRMMRNMGEVPEDQKMVIPEELLNQDDQLSYLYVLEREFNKGRSAKEIRQVILEKCISNKKL